jgi:hypothetical protein
VALETEHVYQAHLKKPRVGRTVGRMATAAPLGSHRHMLVDERPLLVGMAFVANGVTAGQRSHLAHGRRPMRIVAVIALHQTFSDPVVIWFGKIRLGRGVASVAQLGLVLDQ